MKNAKYLLFSKSCTVFPKHETEEEVRILQTKAAGMQ